MFLKPIYHLSILPFEMATPYSGFMKSKDVITEIAEILAAGIRRRYRRDVRKRLISQPTSEKGLAIRLDKSVVRLEPKLRGETR